MVIYNKKTGKIIKINDFEKKDKYIFITPKQKEEMKKNKKLEEFFK